MQRRTAVISSFHRRIEVPMTQLDANSQPIHAMNEMLAAHLPVLAAVADAGGVTAAARALSLTQPAVSNRLRTLEGLAGGPVVRRAGRGVALTELGERLLPHARAVARASA